MNTPIIVIAPESKSHFIGIENAEAHSAVVNDVHQLNLLRQFSDCAESFSHSEWQEIKSFFKQRIESPQWRNAAEKIECGISQMFLSASMVAVQGD